LLLLHLVLSCMLLVKLLLTRLLALVDRGVSKLLWRRLVVLVVGLYGRVLLGVGLNGAVLLVVSLNWVVVSVPHSRVCQVVDSWVNMA